MVKQPTRAELQKQLQAERRRANRHLHNSIIAQASAMETFGRSIAPYLMDDEPDDSYWPHEWEPEGLDEVEPS